MNWGWKSDGKIDIEKMIELAKKLKEEPQERVPDMFHVPVKWKGEWRLGFWPENRMNAYWKQYREWRDEE